MDKLAAHGPMIVDNEHGTYYRVSDIKAALDSAQAKNEALIVEAQKDADGILCHDCLDTGWNEDREGRSVCTCISETEPYQMLETQLAGAQNKVDRYLAALKDIRSSKSEYGFVLARVAAEAIDAIQAEGENTGEHHD